MLFILLVSSSAQSVLTNHDGIIHLDANAIFYVEGDVLITNTGVINNSGTLEWSRLLGDNSSEQGYSLANAPDGGFILTGIWDEDKDMRLHKEVKINIKTLENKTLSKSLRFGH